MKKIALQFLFLIALSSLTAQNITSRITVINGTSLDVYFQNLDQYASGVTLNNYTKLGIYYNDTIIGNVGVGNGWQLKIKPDGDLQSVFSATSIPIDVIDIRVFYNSSETGYTLTGGEQIIASGPDNVAYSDEITISYDIGKTNPIDIVSNERFVLLLEFILESQP